MKILSKPPVLLFLLLSCACGVAHYQAQYIEPNPRVNTDSREIAYQSQKIYSFEDESLQFDNQFSAARMNDCIKLNDSCYVIQIEPENEPINASPWYAFRIISTIRKPIYIQLNYTGAKHRYQPKIKNQIASWTVIADEQVQLTRGDSTATFSVNLVTDTTWIAAQEIISSNEVKSWAQEVAELPYVNIESYGISTLGRELFYLDIFEGSKKKKDILVVLARQHPPEITGHYAMKAFSEVILDTGITQSEFRSKYRVLLFPILNPDGGDGGHWRHNAGGIDLNRDWGNYKQPEIRQTADEIVSQAKRNHSRVVMGIDFHSTQRDIYYTNQVDPASQPLGDLKSAWLEMIDQAIPNYTPNEEASNYLPVATSKNWFYAEFLATGVIYEVGDQTPIDFIKSKAATAAESLMALMLNPVQN